MENAKDSLAQSVHIQLNNPDQTLSFESTQNREEIVSISIRIPPF